MSLSRRSRRRVPHNVLLPSLGTALCLLPLSPILFLTCSLQVFLWDDGINKLAHNILSIILICEISSI
jgi:hypothetical protein